MLHRNKECDSVRSSIACRYYAMIEILFDMSVPVEVEFTCDDDQVNSSQFGQLHYVIQLRKDEVEGKRR
jgi:hypothetical protein